VYGFYINTSIHQLGYITDLIHRLDGLLYTDSEQTFKIIRKDFPGIRVKLLRSIQEIVESMKADGIRCLILQDFHYKKFRELKETGVRFVQIFHGTSDKTYNLNNEILYYDLVCLSGKKMLEDVERRGLNRNKNCVVTGNPKMDMVFKKIHDRDTEIIKLGLNPGLKNVLYAPTWMDGMGNSSFRKFGIKLPDYFPGEYQLTIKLHPNIHLYQKELVEKLRMKIQGKKNMLLIEKSRELYDIVPVLAASDLLITDVSGVSHEYIGFLRPMIFLDNRSILRFFYGKGRKRIWKAGDVVKKLRDLPETIRKNIEYPDRYRKVQESMLEEIYTYTDGKAVARIIEAVKSIT
jgi:CDP-glycerol glycerophosphotransferase (TagB/SpsB family)